MGESLARSKSPSKSWAVNKPGGDAEGILSCCRCMSEATAPDPRSKEGPHHGRGATTGSPITSSFVAPDTMIALPEPSTAALLVPAAAWGARRRRPLA